MVLKKLNFKKQESLALALLTGSEIQLVFNQEDILDFY